MEINVIGSRNYGFYVGNYCLFVSFFSRSGNSCALVSLLIQAERTSIMLITNSGYISCIIILDSVLKGVKT